MRLPLTAGDMKWVYALLGLLVILMAADIGSTTWAISGGAIELNPFLSPYAANLPLFITVKAIGLGIMVGLIEVLNRVAPGCRIFFYVICVVTAIAPLINNLLVINSLT
jgi:hypothetical protein